MIIDQPEEGAELHGATVAARQSSPIRYPAVQGAEPLLIGSFLVRIPVARPMSPGQHWCRSAS